MAITVGLLGRPGSGKSALYTLVTGAHSEQTYLTTGIKPDIATAQVPDERVEKLAAIFKPKKLFYAQFELLDLPGFTPATDKKLVTAALSNYRTCHALAIVVNLFDPATRANSTADTKALLEELMLLDYVQIETLLPVLKKRAAGKEPHAAEKVAIFSSMLAKLEEGIPAYRAGLTPHDQALIREYALLSTRPILIVANLADDMLAEKSQEELSLEILAADFGAGYVSVSAKIEAELAGIENEDERQELMSEFGIAEPGLSRFIRAMYKLLGLKTFFTGSDKDVHAWTILENGTALDAAGAIHSDLARGFIRAEVYPFDELVSMGGIQAFRGTDKFKVVGKDFVISDGDYIIIRFNV